jgi:hypothetical protein
MKRVPIVVASAVFAAGLLWLWFRQPTDRFATGATSIESCKYLVTWPNTSSYEPGPIDDLKKMPPVVGAKVDQYLKGVLTKAAHERTHFVSGCLIDPAKIRLPANTVYAVRLEVDSSGGVIEAFDFVLYLDKYGAITQEPKIPKACLDNDFRFADKTVVEQAAVKALGHWHFGSLNYVEGEKKLVWSFNRINKPHWWQSGSGTTTWVSIDACTGNIEETGTGIWMD